MMSSVRYDHLQQVKQAKLLLFSLQQVVLRAFKTKALSVIPGCKAVIKSDYLPYLGYRIYIYLYIYTTDPNWCNQMLLFNMYSQMLPKKCIHILRKDQTLCNSQYMFINQVSFCTYRPREPSRTAESIPTLNLHFLANHVKGGMINDINTSFQSDGCHMFNAQYPFASHCIYAQCIKTLLKIYIYIYFVFIKHVLEFCSQ